VFPDFATGNSREKSGAVETLLPQDPESPVEEPTTAGEEKERCSTCPKSTVSRKWPMTGDED